MSHHRLLLPFAVPEDERSEATVVSEWSSLALVVETSVASSR